MTAVRGRRFLILLFVCLWLPGFLAAARRCLLRHEAEQQDTYVETVVDFEELRQLARDEGWVLPELMQAVASQGASSIGLSEDTLRSLESEGRIAVMTWPEVQKLSLERTLASGTVPYPEEPGALWVHSRDVELLDRIEHQLGWRLPARKTRRLHRNLLLIRKSSQDFRERVGLGFSPEYLEMASGQGLGVVLRLYNHPGMASEGIRQIVAALPAPASVSALLFAEEEVLGNRGHLEVAVEELKRRSYRIGLVEFNDQEGLDRLEVALSGTRPFVRVHSVSRKELDELYNRPRAVARFLRAVRERRLKMLYIRCFFQDKKKFIGDLVQYNLAYLGSIVRELQGCGFQIPRSDDDRRVEPRHALGTLSGAEQLAIGLSLALGLALLWGSWRGSFPSAAVGLGTAAATGFCFLLLPRPWFTAIFGLIGATAWPTLGVIWGMGSLDPDGGRQAQRGWWGAGAGFLVRMLLPSLVGGTLLAGFHAETLYLLKYAQFRGVKLAFLLPLVLASVWAVRRYGSGFLSILSRPFTLRDVVIAGAVAGGTALYLLRSGNVTFLKPSEFEDLFRTALENLLIARPRNKEFLVGYPAALLFTFLAWRRQYGLLPVLALFIQMGQVSVVNTFCHFHSPLYLAWLRAFNGLWAGVAVGLAAVGVLAAVQVATALGKKEDRVFLIGYFGFDNLGDELLWRAAVKTLREARPATSCLLLHRTGEVADLPPGVEAVPRTLWTDVLAGLAGSRAVMIPGGGVLQAATSVASLAYYLGLLWFARLTGARILLPSQGLGPWFDARRAKRPCLLRRTLLRLAGFLLRGADFLTVRDAPSVEAFRVAVPGGEPPVISGDLVFLPAVATSVRAQPAGKIRLGAILRGCGPETAGIAQALAWLARDMENLQLVPLALRPGEDEAAWQSPVGEGAGRGSGVEGPGFPPVTVLHTAKEADLMLDSLHFLVSMRLHGCVLATRAGLPWIGVEGDPKLAGFAAEIAWTELLPPAEAGSTEVLTNHLNRLGSRYGSAVSHLQDAAHRLHESSAASFASALGRLEKPHPPT